MDREYHRDRRGEWFVPAVGSVRFQTFVGLLFLPYTGMVLAFVVLGALLAPRVDGARLAGLVLIYFLALGVGAHALDALGSRGLKPWGEVFSRTTLRALAAVSILAAYALGGYYILHFAPWLAVIALLEGFFLFAYNLEWAGGRFHTDGWFAFSWGALPVLAGYVLQTNALSMSVVVIAIATALLSLVEIKASRAYKVLRRRPERGLLEEQHMLRFEAILKCISLGTMLLVLGLLIWRATDPAA